MCTFLQAVSTDAMLSSAWRQGYLVLLVPDVGVQHLTSAVVPDLELVVDPARTCQHHVLAEVDGISGDAGPDQGGGDLSYAEVPDVDLI